MQRLESFPSVPGKPVVRGGLEVTRLPDAPVKIPNPIADDVSLAMTVNGRTKDGRVVRYHIKPANVPRR